MNEAQWVHDHLNPQGLPSPVRLEKFGRRELVKLYHTLGYMRGAEIGVAEGRHAKQLCDYNPGVYLLCVDPWIRYVGNPCDGPQKQHNRNIGIAKRILEPFDCEIIQAFSMDAVKGVELDSLDFVYIDANHAFEFAMMDIIEWARRVRSGGIVSGHDYWPLVRDGGVVQAVDAYVLTHGVEEWFLTSEDKQKSWFWIREPSPVEGPK